MSKVVKYYYSSPVIKATISRNPILEKTVINNVYYGKRYTFAALYDDVNKEIRFGAAVCLPQDNFCKKIGREIAEKRALSDPFYIIENFNGIRNDYADKVMKIFLAAEEALMKRDNPGLFNVKNFV